MFFARLAYLSVFRVSSKEEAAALLFSNSKTEEKKEKEKEKKKEGEEEGTYTHYKKNGEK